MPQRLVPALKYLLSLGFAIALFYYLYKDADTDALLAVFEWEDAPWIGLSVLAGLFSHWSRSSRWRIALKPLGHTPRAYTTFFAVMSTYFINLFVPRLGEFVRAGLLKRTDQVPMEQSFGSIIAERAVDLVVLGLLVLLTLWIEFEKIGGFVQREASGTLGFLAERKEWIALTLLALVVLGVLGMRLLWKNRHSWPLLRKLWDFTLGIKSGLLSILRLSPRMKAWYVLHTLNIWLMYYFMGYLLFFCTPETTALSPLSGLTVLAMGAIGMALPSPGGVGTYHLFVAATFIAYGLSDAAGKDFAFLMHSTQTLGVLFLGGGSFLISLSFGRKKV